MRDRTQERLRAMPSPRQAKIMAAVARTGQIPMDVPGVQRSWAACWARAWVEAADGPATWRLTPAGTDALDRYRLALTRLGVPWHG